MFDFLLAWIWLGLIGQAQDQPFTNHIKPELSSNSANMQSQRGQTNRGNATWRSIPINRYFDVLRGPPKNPRYRSLIAQAGRRLGQSSITLSDVTLSGERLRALAMQNPSEPFVRVVRENIQRPIDLPDLVYFLDDLLYWSKHGLNLNRVWVGASRARAAGILVHPDDIFGERPNLYARGRKRIRIDRPTQYNYPKAADGSPPGPRWTKRYGNPASQLERLLLLCQRNESFCYRVYYLMQQLSRQGAQVNLWSSVRDPRRGYLMWGAYRLSRLTDPHEVQAAIRDLNRLNREWNLFVPIRWNHPQGYWATIQAAHCMAQAYDVVFATRAGARRSRHYRAQAVDLTAVNLPRSLHLRSPTGETAEFDLSDPQQPRDLNLTPELIDWLRVHFDMAKLRFDYPHWNDSQIDLVPIEFDQIASGDRHHDSSAKSNLESNWSHEDG